jgi:hypothetical protein
MKSITHDAGWWEQPLHRIGLELFSALAAHYSRSIRQWKRGGLSGLALPRFLRETFPAETQLSGRKAGSSAGFTSL